ncbi:MAG: hypothetical protein PVH61_36155 [Candidatus Aminicenantes bacterium]|jgi:hypothetical protein
MNNTFTAFFPTTVTYLHPDSDLSEESKNLMRQYGALMDELKSKN